jgi:hypothetical protein
VEVILAIGLATTLLLIALVFYRQAADLRQQILDESEKLSTMRLALDRLAGDLRAAQPHASPGNEFSGESNSLQFIKIALTSLPKTASTNASMDNLGQTNGTDPSDLVRVSFMALTNFDGTNVVVSGLDRTEQPLSAPIASSFIPLSTNNPDTNSLSLLGTSATNLPVAQTNLFFEPFAEGIRFVRFRYWNGIDWETAWTNASPPPGVEIVLSMETLPDDATPDAIPSNSFRRVVFLPGGVAQTNFETSFPTNSVAAGTNNFAFQ